ncbi:MAG: carboxypeptidase-like regulatory domain-containing protein [Saprospiraceae bacterium]|nr:carboxypeptidase-like regulatory domain-containing protein [Saprospiraceae bacterium]
MKKNLVYIFALANVSLVFSQKKATIINSDTGEKVPYVSIWVENENLQTTSNADGAFELNSAGSNRVLFSAVGFEDRKVVADSIKDVVSLKPMAISLREVVIKSKRQTQEFSLGTFKRSDIGVYMGCGTIPCWIVARYFEYNDSYAQTPFISRIRVLTSSNVKDAKFNVRLYGVNENGEPGGYIYDDNIIGIAKKGTKITEIDVSDLGIQFPETGFFLALEWFIIENNRYEFEITVEDSKDKQNGFSYEPSFGTIPLDTRGDAWIYTRGKWMEAWSNIPNKMLNKQLHNKYNLLAVALTLTN